MKSILVIISLVLPAMAGGCREADVSGPGDRPAGSGTYIVSEGGFGGGGELSFYDPSTEHLSRDVVRTPLPWLFPNDLLLNGGVMYVAVNGNDLVGIVDPVSDSAIGTISFPPGTGPGFLAAEGTRIYSANYDGTVSLLDPVARTIAATSPRVVGFPGAIVALAGRVYLTDLGAWPDTGARVMALDGATLRLVDSVSPGGGMSGLVAAGGRLYAGAAVTRKLYRIDPATLAIEDSLALGAVPADLATDGAAVYVLTPDAVERVPVASFTRDRSAFLTRTSGLFHYAMAFDADAGEWYVSTITTGGGDGMIGVFDAAGKPAAPPFACGMFPGAFAFYRPAAAR